MPVYQYMWNWGIVESLHQRKGTSRFYFGAFAIFIGFQMLHSGCSNSDEFQPCDSSALISLPDKICLSFEHDQLTAAQRDQIENKLTAGITTIKGVMSIDDLRIRIVNNPGLVIPQIGLGGFNPNEHEVILSINADFVDLEGTLEKNLIPQLAHEIHHAKRRRSAGYGTTLLQAVVSEGLADHFSIEVSGITPPPWSIALSNEELQKWIDIANNSWNQPYNHNDWFFGADPEIPFWTGYAIGFELVKNYLVNNPERLPSNLHNEPANSFAP